MTTFAVVAGVIGAQLSPGVILVIGAANILADGFSMAASNFLGTRIEHEELKRLAAVEKRHIDNFPEGEREDARQIYTEKGVEVEYLRRVVELIISDRKRWVRTMLTEEYGLPQEVRAEWIAAFSAFMLCGLLPLLPFIFGAGRAFALSTLLTGLVFFTIGLIKSRWTMMRWWRSGLETLAVGSVAASLAYVIGVLLKGIA